MTSLEHFPVLRLFHRAVLQQKLFGSLKLLQDRFVSRHEVVRRLQVLDGEFVVLQLQVGDAPTVERFRIARVEFDGGVAGEAHVDELFELQLGGREVGEIHELECVELLAVLVVDCVILE